MEITERGDRLKDREVGRVSMMLSLKIPFSFLISLVIVGLIFLKDEDEHTRNTYDPGIDFDLMGDGLMTTADETMTNMTSLRFERKVPRRSEYQTASKVTLRFRKKVSAVVDLRDAIQIFHRNINPKNFKYISSSDRHQIKNKLMSETITWQPRRCALVGNSGILSESNCGPTIDAHDFVMRMNLAPSGGIYADDVGSKVSITTMNWEQMLLAVRCARNQTDDITKECTELLERMDQVGHGIIWYTKGGYVDRLGIVAGEFFQGHHGSRRHVGPRWAYSPTVMQGVCKKLWKNKNPSTGLIALSVASLFCDHISLFGFYPFEKDPRNRTISYHYYEPHSSKIFFYNKHRMPAEFRIFKMFDKHGAPGNRLVLGPCEDGITVN